jgi:hypothetical protein
MQMFKDSQEGRTTLTLGGKILVIDIELATSGSHMKMNSLKISYAVSNHANGLVPTPPNGMLTEAVPQLNAFLKQCLEAYLEEVQGRQDPLEAERRGRFVREQLEYLMLLDKLAAEEGGAAVKWFKETERIAAVAGEVAKGEVEGVARHVFLVR